MAIDRRKHIDLDRRAFLKTAGVATVAGVAGSALPINAVSWAKEGGTLSVLVQPEVPTLASYLSTSAPVGQTAPKVYDGLLEYNFDLSPRPCLAESWKVSKDGKTVTFHIRKGIIFHDGKPMTAEDVRYSIMDVLREYHPRGKGNFSLIAKAEVPDEHTLVLHLSAPSPWLMKTFSGYESPILPKHLFGPDPVRGDRRPEQPARQRADRHGTIQVR